jgi:hypothetical protein
MYKFGFGAYRRNNRVMSRVIFLTDQSGKSLPNLEVLKLST